MYYYVDGTLALGAFGIKEIEQGETERLLVFFVDKEESLISWNDTENFVIDEGVVTETDFGAAVHEYRDVHTDCQEIETTAAAVTQYLAGVEVQEF